MLQILQDFLIQGTQLIGKKLIFWNTKRHKTVIEFYLLLIYVWFRAAMERGTSIFLRTIVSVVFHFDGRQKVNVILNFVLNTVMQFQNIIYYQDIKALILRGCVRDWSCRAPGYVMVFELSNQMLKMRIFGRPRYVLN